MVVGLVSLARANEVPVDSNGGLSVQLVAQELEFMHPAIDTSRSGQSELDLPMGSELNAEKDAQVPLETGSVDLGAWLDQTPTLPDQLPEVTPQVNSASDLQADLESGDAPIKAEPGPEQAPTEEQTSLPSSDPPGQPALKSTRQVEIDHSQFHQMIPRDEIEPVYQLKFVSAADSLLQVGELVIGVEINGESQAYPIGPLNQREMVNDEVEGY